jgi:poly-D-alanine transfer protein DltD
MRVRLLVICQPINEKFNETKGLTSASSTFFYRRLRRAFAGYDTPLLTMPEEGLDPHFYRDCVHPSAKAWLIYDRALNAFYHSAAPWAARS